MKIRKHWFAGAIAAGAVAAMVAVPASIAGAETTSWTTVTSSANPVAVGVNFTVSAQECNRVADSPPTGTIVFKDKTTGEKLGSVATTPDPEFANCSDASVKDSETLAAGTYKIKGSYKPGGATPAAKSSASYRQKVG